jgi:16S rRNA (uracil1498-N3)-methyltransferase
METSHEHFYVLPDDVSDNYLILRGDEFKHAAKVLRKNRGSHFAAVDGLGNWFECELVDISTTFLKARILERFQNIGEPKFRLTLAVGLLKSNRFDWIIEKGTEIGVCCFVPVLCERSISRTDNKLDRFKRIALAAIKQCGRSVLPIVKKAVPFEDLLQQFSYYDCKIIAQNEIQSINSSLDNLISQTSSNTGVILIGPEGGFSRVEVEQAISAGFVSISLGEKRLRSETAALITAAQLLTKMGELG